MATSVGFAGGTLANPTYQQVCKKDTGHAEVVLVDYDTRLLPTEELLTAFFELHNFEINRGVGTGQYRSAIFALKNDDPQLAIAEDFLERLRAAGYHPYTEVGVADAFYPAAGRHQQYCTTRGVTPSKRKGKLFA